MSNVEMNDQALPLGFVYTLEVVDQFGQVIDSRTCKNIIPRLASIMWSD